MIAPFTGSRIAIAASLVVAAIVVVPTVAGQTPAVKAKAASPIETLPSSRMATRLEISAKDPQLGKAVYTKWCSVCHAEGPAFAGTIALAELYKGTEIPAALEKRTDLDPEYIRYVVRNGKMMMPTFRKTEINDAELEAAVKYLTGKNKK